MTDSVAYFAENVRLTAEQIDGQMAESAAFLQVTTELTLAHYDLAPDEIQSATRFDGTNDLGVDAFYQSDDEEVIYIIQAKSGERSPGDQRKDINELRAVPSELLNPVSAARANSAIKEILPSYRDALERGFAVRLVYAIAIPLAPRNRRWLEAAVDIERPRDFMNADLSIDVLDAPALESRYGELIGIKGILSCDVDFSLDGAVYHCGPEKPFRVIDVTIPAMTLLRAHEQYGTEIFRYNPRFDLGRNDVNKEIEESIRASPGIFHLLNNGVTAVCDGFRIDSGAGVLHVEDFQIVNGCQTTRTLWRVSKNSADALDSCFVNLRLIEGQAIQSSISRATNRQTALVYTDDLANRPEQRHLRNAFGRMAPPWFYEAKRGEWNLLEGAARAKYARNDVKGRYRRLKPQQVAQATRASLGAPGEAKDRPRAFLTNVDENATYQEIFKSRAYQLLLPALLHEQAGGWSREVNAELVAAQDPWVGWVKYAIVYLAYRYVREVYEEDVGLLDERMSKRLVTQFDSWAPDVVAACGEALNGLIAARTNNPAECRRYFRQDDNLDEMFDALSSQIRTIDRARDRLELEPLASTLPL